MCCYWLFCYDQLASTPEWLDRSSAVCGRVGLAAEDPSRTGANRGELDLGQMQRPRQVSTSPPKAGVGLDSLFQQTWVSTGFPCNRSKLLCRYLCAGGVLALNQATDTPTGAVSQPPVPCQSLASMTKIANRPIGQ